MNTPDLTVEKDIDTGSGTILKRKADKEESKAVKVKKKKVINDQGMSAYMKRAASDVTDTKKTNVSVWWTSFQSYSCTSDIGCKYSSNLTFEHCAFEKIYTILSFIIVLVSILHPPVLTPQTIQIMMFGYRLKVRILFFSKSLFHITLISCHTGRYTMNDSNIKYPKYILTKTSIFIIIFQVKQVMVKRI